MKEIKFIVTKTGKVRAYRYAMRQMRWFPMGLEDARLAISTGQARDVSGARWTICPGLPGKIHRMAYKLEGVC